MSLSILLAGCNNPRAGFNPPKGILFIVTHHLALWCLCRPPGFNPPKGILFIVTVKALARFVSGRAKFQSPEGDSLHCHGAAGAGGCPLIGKVSIPRRGFSSLSLRTGLRGRTNGCCFNPPKGILFIVTTFGARVCRRFITRFNPPKGILFIVTCQFLAKSQEEGVSIPRRGFSSLSLLRRAGVLDPDVIVSIPRRGFSSLSRAMLILIDRGLLSPDDGFNPPKGILFIVTSRKASGMGRPSCHCVFQSPEGDSLHCHVLSSRWLQHWPVTVSIPRRGFSSLSPGLL